MRTRTFVLCLIVVLGASLVAAQPPVQAIKDSDIYCSGIVTVEAVPRDTYLITGEGSNYKVTFAQGDLVYINKGADQGLKVGDEFLVIRQEKDPLRFKWFAWQPSLLRAMGTNYQDMGRLRVLHVGPNVATAEIVFSCGYMQRGDIILPLVPRPVPPVKEKAKFDPFVPPSGKDVAMVVIAKDFAQEVGDHNIIYVNLGSGQGVKVGDYFRIFRYNGTQAETAYQTYGMAYKVYGFGSTPRRYRWDELPREILGEGIVLRVSPNSSTVLITYSARQIYTGDYVELE